MTDANLFANIPEQIPAEIFEPIVQTSGLKIERILSLGQTTPPGQWYDQERPEWVILLRGRARLLIEGEASIRMLQPGDYLHLAAHGRHRVEWTDPDQVCVWLAVHYAEEEE